MKSLFRQFERAGLDYLLVSGQASILYGAATFSEDVDIWIRPTAANARRLLRALAARRARVYKLTPPLTQLRLRTGHGFHFLVPSPALPVYLDVMGRPPRVGSFAQARRRSRRVRTGWGTIPVVSIPDLVLMKMTRRLQDYEVISNLVQVRLREVAEPSLALLHWAARSTFRAEDRAELMRRLGRHISPEPCRRAIAREIAALQARDVAYWRPVIADLRHLHRAGLLWPAGTPVADLVRLRPPRS